MKALSTSTDGFTDSVIRRMTRVALKHGAVNLSQGFPDFDPPKELLDRLAQVAYEGPHQYALTWGAQNFREALAAKQTRYMGRTIDPNSEIVVTCGSTEAMMTAMMTVTNPGDKMDISEFGYDSDLKFCEELAAKVGVGAVPGSSFFREPVNHLIRFHFAKKDETLNDALNRLEALRSKIPARAAR